jgi:hypothetical protein
MKTGTIQNKRGFWNLSRNPANRGSYKKVETRFGGYVGKCLLGLLGLQCKLKS